MKDAPYALLFKTMQDFLLPGMVLYQDVIHMGIGMAMGGMLRPANGIPFNYPVFTGKEIEYITEAVEHGHTSSNGPFTKKCQAWIEAQTGCQKAFLTHSCTAALEMSAILAGIAPGDEVIMPSYTFVSTANAFVLRSAVPVFVDILSDTLNIDETKIEAAITEKTRAIVPVLYRLVHVSIRPPTGLRRGRGL